MLRTNALLLPYRWLGRRLSFSILLVGLAVGTASLSPAAARADDAGEKAAAVPATIEERDELLEKSQSLCWTDQLEEAAEILERVAAFDRQQTEGDPDRAAATLEDLAGIRILQDRLGDAWLAAQESVRRRKEKFAADDWRVASSQILLEYIDRLAQLDRSQREERSRLERQFIVHVHKGEYERAIPPALDVEKIERLVLKPEHPYYANTWLNVGDCQYQLGNYDQAEPLLQKALAAYEASLGKRHPYVAMACYGLGKVYEAQNDLAKAELFYRRALEIRRQQLGAKNPDSVATLWALAHVLADMAEQPGGENRVADACDIWRALVEQLPTEQGEQDWQIAEARANLAHLERLAQLTPAQCERYRKAGQLNAEAESASKKENHRLALVLREEQLAIMSEILGDQDLETACVLSCIGVIYHHLADYTPAETHLRKALAIRESVLGRTHPDCANSLGSLGTVFFDRNDWEQAEQLYRQAAEILAKSVGEEDKRWRDTTEALATTLLERAEEQVGKEEFAVAVESQREAVTLLETLFGDEDERVIDARKEVERLESRIKNDEAAPNVSSEAAGSVINKAN